MLSLVVIYFRLALFVQLYSAVGGRSREHETVITGSAFHGRAGTFQAPPEFPSGPYERDYTTHVFVLENISPGGSIQLVIDVFDLHPDSWLIVKNSKYGGYVGRELGRYDLIKSPPPAAIVTNTCCLRLEFQTGCCGPAIAGALSTRAFTGFRASYRMLLTPGRGRIAFCSGHGVYNQYCNGECVPAQWDCPCRKYGQFKCRNARCLPDESLCDGKDDCGDQTDEHYCKAIRSDAVYVPIGIYALSEILKTVCSILAVCVLLILILGLVEPKIRPYCTGIIHATRRHLTQARPVMPPVTTAPHDRSGSPVSETGD